MTLLCSLLLFALAPLARAGTSRTGAAIFQEPFGARPFAMGQAYGAYGDDVYGMFYNPAILSRLKESQVAAQYVQSIQGIQLGYLGLASPLSPTQALGFGAAYLDAGKINVFDDNGNPVSSLNAERDFDAQLGYAHSLDIGAGRLHAGGAAKILRSSLVETAQATALAADLGGLYEFPWRKGVVSAGLAASNLGPSVRYSLSGGGPPDPLPMTTRLALAYAKEVFSADSLGFATEFDRVFYDNSTSEAFGMEYNYHRLFSLRLGYRPAENLGNFSMGFGVQFKDLAIDYAMALMQTFNNVQQFSITYRFTVPGVRYGAQYSAGLTPIESLAEAARKDIAGRRYFDAKADVERLDALFPGTSESAGLKAQIQKYIQGVAGQGPSNPRYEYASALQAYQNGDLKGAMAGLQASFVREPDNAEIQNYFDKARRQYQEARNQQELRRQARIGVLFDLADQAYEEGNPARALRIADEVLRIGPYRPAEKLKQTIAEESRRAAIRRAAPPAPKPPRASANPPRQTEVAARRASPEEAARAEQLYLDAVRSYAEYVKNSQESDLQKALNGLEAAAKLNPEDSNIREALDSLRKMIK